MRKSLVLLLVFQSILAMAQNPRSSSSGSSPSRKFRNNVRLTYMPDTTVPTSESVLIRTPKPHESIFKMGFDWGKNATDYSQKVSSYQGEMKVSGKREAEGMITNVSALTSLYNELWAGVQVGYVSTSDKNKIENYSETNGSTKGVSDPEVGLGYNIRSGAFKVVPAFSVELTTGDAQVSKSRESNAKNGGNVYIAQVGTSYNFDERFILAGIFKYEKADQAKVKYDSDFGTVSTKSQRGDKISGTGAVEFPGRIQPGAALTLTRIQEGSSENQTTGQKSYSPAETLLGLGVFSRFTITKNFALTPSFSYGASLQSDTSSDGLKNDKFETYNLGLTGSLAF